MFLESKLCTRHEGLATVSSSGVNFSFAAGLICEENLQLNSSLSCYTFVVVLSGEGELTSQRQQASCKLVRGNFFQIAPGQSCNININCPQNWKIFYATIPVPLFELFVATNCENLNGKIGYTSLNHDLLISFNEYLDLLASIKDNNASLLLPKLCYLVTGCINNSTIIKESAFLKKTKSFLNSQHDQKLDMELFAKKNGVSYAKLRKNFKDKYGVSPHKYRIQCRMDKAIELLSDLDKPIKVVASQLGYSTQYDFSKQFKSYFAVTPTQYRKRGL
ncbi:AraC family transcriptional regulator [Lentisphaerota bacterium WC36G]|nr:AraC family transcriptional regulator [Lentisphaerae bacterium WC36]